VSTTKAIQTEMMATAMSALNTNKIDASVGLEIWH
jgi:hypothetical protein